MIYPRTSSVRTCTSLDGIWKVMFASAEDAAVNERVQACPDGTATDIAFPGSINEQLCNRDQYLNTGPVWCYRHFQSPALPDHQRAWLRFGSATYRAEVFLDGERLGAHEGGYLPFEFEVTEALRKGGDHLLVVRLDNTLDATTIPQGNLDPSVGGVAAWRPGNYPNVHYDFFPYMGLHRPVTLYTTGPARLSRLRLTTDTLETSKARLRIRAEVEGAVHEVKFTVAGQQVTGVPTVDDGRVELEMEVTGIEPWSTEHPRLYPVDVRLFCEGELVDHHTEPFGFRTIKVSGDQLLLNDEPVFLRGFGRHEDHPILGKGLSLPHLVREYELLDWVGANSFRTSHYPYSEEDMYMADERGILIIDETAANTLCLVAVEEDDAAFNKLLSTHAQHLVDLIERDANHPSVIAWSLSNECELSGPRSREYFGHLFTLARQHDDRPVSLVTQANPYPDDPEFDRVSDLSDLLMINKYPGWYTLQGQLDEVAEWMAGDLEQWHQQYGKPIILTEFGADAITGLHDVHSLMWTEEYQVDIIRRVLDAAARYPYVIGTHVWNLADFKVGQHTTRIVYNWKGVFTRDRHPKAAAHYLRGRWKSGS